ncbi:MAG: CRISPR-associated protein Cas6 [Gammaproteobacteria bacterium]|jgi:CRISPR-associated protein Cas6
MLWQEEDSDPGNIEVSLDVFDLVFKIESQAIPIDHAHCLHEGIISHLPWMIDEPAAGIHQIHVAESSNGWIRPTGAGSLLMPSRRTRLIIRLPLNRLKDAENLCEKIIELDGYSLKINACESRPLSKMTTLFARYVDTAGFEDDSIFIDTILAQLMSQQIRVKKMLSGLETQHLIYNKIVRTRKLMVSGLSIADSIKLQQIGLGDKKLFGIGLFLPHKGIDAVRPD